MQITQQEPLSVPRRAIDFEDYIDILRRHRAWILGPLFFGVVAGVVTAFLWPDSYRASGMIRVMPSVVAQRLMNVDVSGEMLQRLNTIYGSIVSRPSLTNIITTYKLYPDDVKKLPMEDVVELMRKDIKMSQVNSISFGQGNRAAAFSIGYSYRDRHLAKKVADELVSRFINESQSAGSKQSDATKGFVEDQLSVARRELEDIDRKITSLKMRNPGESPDQAQMLVSRLMAIESNMTNISTSLSRASQDKLQMEMQLRTVRDNLNQLAAQPTPSPETLVAQAGKSDALNEVDHEIARMEATLVALKEQYKETHPDVQRVEIMLAGKKKQREQILAEVTSARPEVTQQRGQGANPASTREMRDLSLAVTRLQSAIQAKDLEIENLNRQMVDSREKSRMYTSQLQASPGAAEELFQQMRERDLAQAKYQDLVKRKDQTEMVSDLQNRKQGETLEVLELPITPQKPYSPDRWLIVLGGIVGGGILGVVFAAVREVKDTSLKNLKDVRAYTKLTVLASIPLLENDFVIRRRRRLAWLAWSAACLFGILLMTGSVMYYFSLNT